MQFIKKLTYSKPNDKRGRQYALTLPNNLIDELGITEDDREVVIYYNPIVKEIKIKKKITDKEWDYENNSSC